MTPKKGFNRLVSCGFVPVVYGKSVFSILGFVVHQKKRAMYHRHRPGSRAIRAITRERARIARLKGTTKQENQSTDPEAVAV